MLGVRALLNSTINHLLLLLFLLGIYYVGGHQFLRHGASHAVTQFERGNNLCKSILSPLPHEKLQQAYFHPQTTAKVMWWLDGGLWRLLGASDRVQLVICLEIADCGQLTANNWHQHEMMEEPWKHLSLHWTLLLQTEFCLWKNWRRKTSKYNEMETTVMCGSLKMLPWNAATVAGTTPATSLTLAERSASLSSARLMKMARCSDSHVRLAGCVVAYWGCLGKFVLFFSCCWLHRQGKHPLWQSGLELYTKYTLPPCCN